MKTDTYRTVPQPDTPESPVKSTRGHGPRITRDLVSRIIVWTNVALALVVTVLSFFSADSGRRADAGRTSVDLAEVSRGEEP